MATNVISPLSTVGDVRSRIPDLFERQRATALRLRSSTAAERIARIVKLRDAFIAHTETWYQAGHADFRKPPGEVDLAVGSRRIANTEALCRITPGRDRLYAAGFLAIGVTTIGSRWASEDQMACVLRLNAVARWVYVALLSLFAAIAIRM